MTKTSWRLDDARQTLVISAPLGRCPCVVYWGTPLPQTEDLSQLAATGQIDVTGGMLDLHPDLSLCPDAGQSFPGQPGLVVREADGTLLFPRLMLEGLTETKNALLVTCADPAIGLTYHARIVLNPDTHVITFSARIQSDRPLRLTWLAAPVLPAPQRSDDIIDFSGRWCGEFQINQGPWSAGARSRENRTGRTGHEHFPGLILPCRGTTNTMGEAYAFHYGWSGGHQMIAEELPDGRRQIQFGHARDTETQAATQFETAPLYGVYSGHGLNGCAVSFQRHLRDHIVSWPQPDRPRPVHYNCWEAVYFNHDLAELKGIATRAATLGAERFVLDDGWFLNRDDDTSSLGDWDVDPRKYPNGLDPLIAHVQAEGMTFGIWFEPEMLNPDSALYRAHPDWALGAPDQILGRQQMVLNMALPEVRDYLYDKISSLLAAHEIEYIKWDHNRVLPIPDAAQTRGTYLLLDQLRAAFPHVEIESCASGGGRIDFGILSRTQRVWLSDSNDALERLGMQHNAALFLPSVVTGSHVGPRVCHTSSRQLDMAFRVWIAAQRHLGFEMDPRELTPDEEAVLKDVTTWWKENRSWLARADILRLDRADPAVTAEQQLAEEGDRFVVFAAKAATSSQIAPRPLCLTGLAPSARYRITLRNRDTAPTLSRGEMALKEGPVTLSGAALMHRGLTLPWSFPESIWVLEGQRL